MGVMFGGVWMRRSGRGVAEQACRWFISKHASPKRYHRLGYRTAHWEGQTRTHPPNVRGRRGKGKGKDDDDD